MDNAGLPPSQGDIDNFDPQAFIAAGSAPKPSASPVTDVEVNNFDPQDFINQGIVKKQTELQGKYGSPAQQAIAALEAAAGTATLGASHIAETKLFGVNPHDILARQEANPWSSFGGSVLGGGALLAATGGLGGLAEGVTAAAGKGLLGSALGVGAEGAVLGAGAAVSDAALGDPNLNAQKILAHVGTGFVTGAALGALGHGLRRVLGKTPVEAGAAPKEGGPAPEGIVPGEPIPGEAPPLVDTTKPGGGMPKSLEEMEQATKEAVKYGGESVELPQKQIAIESAGRLNPHLDEKFRINDYMLKSLDNQDAWNEFSRTLQMPGKDGTILRDYSRVQKNKLQGVLDRTIENEIAPGYQPTTNAQTAGERAAELFTNKIETTRGELAPAFEAIKSTPLNQMDHLPNVIDYLTNKEASPYANPKILNMFDTAGDELAVKPYTSSMGVDKATYRAVKEAITSLEEKPKSFENLFDIRKGLSQHVDVTKLGDAAKEVASAKAAMMDYIQEAVQSVEPDLAVRETFKNWAKNEQNAQMIERKFGAQIGSNNWRTLAKGGDEGILKKIFRDSESVNAAKEILGDQEFSKILADHVAILRNDVTDQGVFSSRKFDTLLNKRTGQYGLAEAFAQNQEAYQKIKDATTLMKMFPDSLLANPSKTTQTAIESIISGLEKNGIDPIKHIANLGEMAKSKLGEFVEHRELNKKIAGERALNNQQSRAQNLLKNANDNLNKAVSAIFDSKNAARGAALGGASYLSSKAYDEVTQGIKNYYANPETLLQDMASHTQDTYHGIPNISQSLSATITRGITFLQSKIPNPRPNEEMPLGPKWQPTQQQKAQFNQYYQAVNEPTVVLKQLKSGSLTNETMEALTAVHPDLLSDLQQRVLPQVQSEKAKDLSYSKKLSLSKFLNQPLEGNMTPQAIMSNQAAFNAPRESEQGQPEGRRSTLGGLKQLNMGQRAETRTGRKEEK